MAPHRKIAVMVIVGVAHSICTGIDEGTHWMTETKSRRLERRLHSFASIREQERRSHSLEFKNELRLQLVRWHFHSTDMGEFPPTRLGTRGRGARSLAPQLLLKVRRYRESGSERAGCSNVSVHVPSCLGSVKTCLTRAIQRQNVHCARSRCSSRLRVRDHPLRAVPDANARVAQPPVEHPAGSRGHSRFHEEGPAESAESAHNYYFSEV